MTPSKILGPFSYVKLDECTQFKSGVPTDYNKY